ncbi:hypothetical protein ACIPJK_37045 [Streptomyces roseus]
MRALNGDRGSVAGQVLGGCFRDDASAGEDDDPVRQLLHLGE